MSSKIFLPGLNGIRAIAAFAVIISHINNRLNLYNLENNVLLDLASFGVTMFFTLSGFLITFLLLKELEKTGDIDIKKFYMRRVLRIWPLYYMYLLIIILMTGVTNIRWPILFYLLIIPNLKNSFVGIFNTAVGSKATSFMVGHYWSLGVEEQFYAFWPWIVKKTNILLKFLILFPIFYIVLKLLLRVFNAPYNILVFINYTRFGCLVIGGLGAYLYFNHKELLNILNNKWVEISAWIFFVIVSLNSFHITSIIDHEIVSIFTLIIIFNQVNNSKRLISLENKYFDYLGKISFGLYVYNPLIIYLISFVLKDIPNEYMILKKLLIYILVIFVIIFVSHISYHYFEKKFLKIKTKYTTVESAASRIEANNS